MITGLLPVVLGILDSIKKVPWVKLAPFIMVGVVAFLLFWQWNTIQKQKIKLEAQKIELEKAIDANSTLEIYADKLKEENLACNALFIKTRVEADETALELERARNDLLSRQPEVIIKREEIFREPSCNELNQIDIAAQCPALAERMRVRSGSGD